MTAPNPVARRPSVIPTAAKIAPATTAPDHADHAIARLYDDWRLLEIGFSEALLQCPDDDDSAAQPIGDRARATLCALARHPASTVCGVALKLVAAWHDQCNLTELPFDELEADEQAVKGARLDVMRLAKSATTDAQSG